ncbi:MAG: InlB B-repeat-containing protein [Oscillospiraceae bacterium]|nr:InlB B-repeat-containing protein [Oscillospiraceae bacterium]
MKKRYRLLAALLAAVTLLTLLPVSARADHDDGEPEEPPLIELDGEPPLIVFCEEDETEALPPLPEDLPAEPAEENEGRVFRFLTETMGVNAAAACGVLANIYCESGFDPTLYGDNGTSYGICQWHAERFTALQDYCGKNGYDYRTLDGQLHFLQYELENDYADVAHSVFSAAEDEQGAYEAGYAWCYHFERPADYPRISVIRGELARNTYWVKYRPQSYVNGCSRWSAYLALTVRSDTVLCSQPCLPATDASSEELAPAAAGQTLTATALYKNTADEYWYRVKTEDARTAYVRASEVESGAALSEIACAGKPFPEELRVGESLNVDWIITSAYLELETAEGRIYGGLDYGREMVTPGRIEGIGKTSLNLTDSAIDNALTFRLLPSGFYKAEISVTARCWFSPDGKTLESAEIAATPISFYFCEVEEDSDPCTVTFDPNGGVCGTVALRVPRGHLIDSLPIATRRGYRFLGWAKERDAQSADYGPDKSYPVTRDVTLYAVWRFVGWTAEDGVLRYYKKDGTMVTGWMKLGENRYYLKKSDGSMVTGWATIAGKRYYFKKADGTMVTGRATIAGKRYYFKKSDGTMVTGWATIAGKRCYFKKSDGSMVTGWATVAGKRYYFKKSDGTMVTGWANIAGKRYFFKPSDGTMVTGWAVLNAKRYYFSPETGAMQTGWITVDGVRYYMGDDGAFQYTG